MCDSEKKVGFRSKRPGPNSTTSSCMTLDQSRMTLDQSRMLLSPGPFLIHDMKKDKHLLCRLVMMSKWDEAHKSGWWSLLPNLAIIIFEARRHLQMILYHIILSPMKRLRLSDRSGLEPSYPVPYARFLLDNKSKVAGCLTELWTKCVICLGALTQSLSPVERHRFLSTYEESTFLLL